MTEATAPRTVLAVDDSASMRRMVGFTLESAGYRVIEAVDGRDALDKLGTHRVDLVLADQNMPRMDGLTLVRELRAQRRHATLPVLILTTESGDEMRSAGRAAGATGWMVKPFDPARLLDVVGRVMDRASGPGGRHGAGAR